MTVRQLLDKDGNNIYPLAHPDSITSLTNVTKEKLANSSVGVDNIYWADFRIVTAAETEVQAGASIALPDNLYDYDQLKMFYIVEASDDGAATGRTKLDSITIPTAGLKVDGQTKTISFLNMVNTSFFRIYFLDYQVTHSDTGYSMNFTYRYYTYIHNGSSSSSGTSTDKWTIQKSYLLKLH